MTRYLASFAVAVGILAGGASGPAAQKPSAAPVIVLETVQGTIQVETFPDDAPKTVARIVELIKRNFYNGLRFHRAEKNLVQVGDPVSRDMSRQAWWGQGGSGKPIGVAEISRKRRHVPGAVAMAHSGDPKYADSQIYIITDAKPSLDGKHAVFGRVTSGLDVVRRISRGDILKKASVKE